MYAQYGQIMIDELSTVRNIKLGEHFEQGNLSRIQAFWATVQNTAKESVSYLWHQNFDMVVDVCEEYARR